MRRGQHAPAHAPAPTRHRCARWVRASRYHEPHAAVESARVSPGRVVLWLAPFADQAFGNTVWVRLNGARAADTLGGRLRGDAAATVASERDGGWRVVRVGRPARSIP